MKTEHWAYIGIGLICLYCFATCDSCSDDETSYSDDSIEYNEYSDQESSAPSWIQGTWYCVTPYGNMQIEIWGNTIREIPGDGSSYFSEYSIQGDYIMPNSGSHMHYEMDRGKKRILAGQGYYFTKQ